MNNQHPKTQNKGEPLHYGTSGRPHAPFISPNSSLIKPRTCTGDLTSSWKVLLLPTLEFRRPERFLTINQSRMWSELPMKYAAGTPWRNIRPRFPPLEQNADLTKCSMLLASFIACLMLLGSSPEGGYSAYCLHCPWIIHQLERATRRERKERVLSKKQSSLRSGLRICKTRQILALRRVIRRRRNWSGLCSKVREDRKVRWTAPASFTLGRLHVGHMPR